jgi:hypothetical protein
MLNVRFGSKADMCNASTHVRFTPNSDRESDFPQTVMSALPPKADMCGAMGHVCFGPEADIVRCTAGTQFADYSEAFGK